jgi:hypothetical protein
MCAPLPTAAGAPEIEITPEMIQAGVQAYYESAFDGWQSPGGSELREMIRTIFLEMWLHSHSAR